MHVKSPVEVKSEPGIVPDMAAIKDPSGPLNEDGSITLRANSEGKVPSFPETVFEGHELEG